MNTFSSFRYTLTQGSRESGRSTSWGSICAIVNVCNQFSFFHFRWRMKFIPGVPNELREQEQIRRKASNGQRKLFNQRDHLVPCGAVENWTISNWSFGGPSPPYACLKFFLCFFFFFFRSLSLCSLWKFFFFLNFLLNKVYDDGFGLRRGISVKERK